MATSSDPAANEADFKFIMKCIECCTTKFVPDFEQVATQTGKKDRTAARLHLNSILRKWGISQSQKTSDSSNGTGPVTPKTPKTPKSATSAAKRGGKKRNRSDDTDGDVEDGQKDKKVKVENSEGDQRDNEEVGDASAE